MPQKVDLVLDTTEEMKALADELKDARSVLFIGRHVGYPVALEGALKLKELAYMHAEGFAAGELKHGPIALLEDGVPVVVVVPSPTGRSVLHEKIVSNIQEVRARGARTIVIAEEGDEAVVPYADHLVRIPASRPRCSSRSSRPCRCRSSPPRWPRPRATTSTSPATSPSPSPSSSALAGRERPRCWLNRCGAARSASVRAARRTRRRDQTTVTSSPMWMRPGVTTSA